MQVNFEVTDEDRALIECIIDRAEDIAAESDIKLDRLSLTMDIIAVNNNDGALNLSKLLNAPRATFCHDVWGIRRHIDRETGKLNDCFVPRCTKDESGEWTICKGCGEPMKTGGRFANSCSAMCFRNANC